MIWLGWAYLNKKVHGPWQKGVCLNLPQGIAKIPRAVFTYRTPGATRKKPFLGPPGEALVVPPSIQKPSQKHQKLTFIG
jgi:hypothetical protein